MNFRMKSGLVFLSFLMAFSAIGQNDFFFNHYMFNPSYYNPAWVGSEGEAFVAGHHRSQWVGYSSSFDGNGGAPSSQLISLVIPAQGKLSGVGLAVSNDRTAELTNLQARFSVSVKKDFRFGSISVGAMPTLFSQSLDFGNFRPVEPEPNLPDGRESQMAFDLSAGVYFNSDRNYFAGFSAINLMQPSFNYGITGDQLSSEVSTNYLINGGTVIGVSRDILFKPTTLIRTDFKSYTFELSGLLYYQEKMWGGLSFRRSESVTLMLGYSFLEDNKLRFGYSFDYVVKDQAGKQPTSHEVYIRYDLPDLILGGRKAVKTPRFNF
ncbi:MAG: PorP/SprF family type IX secretion system membrane protein [Cyclobacteriaceae bacterium]